MTPPLMTAARRSDEARWLAGAAASLAMAVGALVLVGWALDITALKSVLPGLIPMATNTAVGFILAGAALWDVRQRDTGAPTSWVATACAVAVTLIGLLTLPGYLGWSLNVDQFQLGRMAPTTALNFLLLGCVLLIDRPGPWTVRTVLAAVFAYTALAVSLITLVGYLYGVDSLFNVAHLTPMAVHTAATFALLSAGVLCARPDRGLVAILTSATTGGLAARRLLPVALIAPVLLGAVRLAGQRRGWYGTELGVALFALASSGVIGLLVWWTGRSLHRIDSLRAQAEHDLRVSDERARLALDAARLGTFDWEVPQNKIVWSSRHEQLFGFAPGEFGGTYESFADRVHHQDLPGVSAEVARCMASHESFLHEFRVVRPDGSTRWIEARGEFHFNSSGLAQRMRGVVLDTTERRRAEEQQALQGAALNAAADAMIITDANGTIEWVNAAFTRSTGYGAEDALGRNPRDLFKSGVHDRAFYQHLWETILAGQVWSGEMTNRRKDGSLAVEDQTISPVRNSVGDIAHFIAVKRDVTDRRRAEDQLRDQARLLDNARDAIIVRSLDQHITYWNKGAEQLYGWTADEAVGQSVDNLGSNRTPEFDLALKDVLRTGEWIGELHQTGKGGRKLIVESRWALVRDEAGTPKSILAINTDMTERKRAEEAVREREHRLSESQRIAHIGSWLYDLKGKMTWTEEMYRLYGVSRDAFTVNVASFIELIHPDDRVAMQAWIAACAAGAKPGDLEFRCILPDGTVRVIAGRGELMYDAEHRPTAMTGTAQDVTERRRAEDRLRELAALLDLAQDAIVVRDLQHHVTYWNKGAERLYGWTAEEAAGQSVAQGYPDIARFKQALDHVLRTGASSGEVDQVAKDGRKLIVESRWTLLRDAAGQPSSVLVIDTDVTERKNIEQQFLRAQRLESLGTLAGGIAHDLNNILAPILMSTELLKDSLSVDGDAALLNTIETSAKRGADLVGQILLFARGTDGRRTQIPVGRLIRDMEKIARETFPKHIDIGVTTNADLWMPQADPTQLHQVLMNLCVNARDAMPDGGRLSIAARNVHLDALEAASILGARPGPHVVIEVKDTGTGIPAAVLDKIFDPFFTTKAPGKGTGLGLSTSLTIVKNHGGFLRVQSQPGAGTRFAVYLPTDAKPQAAETAAGLVTLPRGRGEVVLVVDDEVAIREITRQVLEVSGYRVLLAANGAEGLAQYRQHQAQIAAVITDGRMPGMDGAALIEALASINPAVRILAVSGETTWGIDARGALQVLAKPFTAMQLLTALQQLLAVG
jgi:PAS domain S-box-containing protein